MTFKTLAPQHCASCDSFIKNAKDEAKPNPEYLTGPVESNIFRRYLLQSADKSEIDGVLQEFCDLNKGQKGIPLCPPCMELITRIYDFENEIDRLKSLIDSIVTQLKGRVQGTLDQVRKGSGSEPLKKLRVLVSQGQGENSYDQVKSETLAGSTGTSTFQELMEDVRSTYQMISEKDVNSTVKDNLGITLKVKHKDIPSTDQTEEQSDQSKPTPKLKLTSIPDVTPSTGRVTRRAKEAAKKFLTALNSDDDKTNNEDHEGDIAEISSEETSQKSWTDDQELDILKGNDSDPGYIAEECQDSDDDDQQDEDDDDEEDEEETVVVKAFKIDPENPARMSLMDDPENARMENAKHKLVVRKNGKKFLLRPEKRPKRLPGEVPPSQVRKTARRNRKVTRIGPDRYEFGGHQYYKLEDGKYKCETCGNVLKTRDSALTHVKRSHLGEGLGSYLCDECGKSFIRDCNYRAHLLVHGSLATYQCETCGKAFKQLANLVAHKKIHFGEFKYHCEYAGCGRGFHRRLTYQAHIKRRHLDLREIPCDMCDKHFVTNSDLNQHRKCHFEKRIPCPYCDSNFLRNGHMLRHVRNIHRMDTSQIVLEQSKKAPEHTRLTECS